MRYHVPPSLLAQPGRSQNWAMDTRRHAFDLMGRRHGLELGEADAKKAAINRLLMGVAAGRQQKKAEQAAADAEPGFFGSGGGTSAGALVGAGIGTLIAPGAGTMLGATLGGAAGGVADVALAPGTPGAAAGAQQAANLPSSLIAYDRYYGEEAQADRGARRGLRKAQTDYYNRRDATLSAEVKQQVADQIQRMGGTNLQNLGGFGLAQRPPTEPIFTGPSTPGPSPFATGPLPYRDYDYARFGM